MQSENSSQLNPWTTPFIQMGNVLNGAYGPHLA